MRTLRLGLVSSMISLIVLVPIPPAGACSCAFEPVTTHLRNASIAFVGQARDTVDEPSGLVTTFRVERVFKGAPPARIKVTTARDEAACGVPFVEGRAYAVFVGDQGGTLTTNLCSGTTDDLSAISSLLPIAVATPSPRAAPADQTAGVSRAAPIAVAGLLIALLAAASALAVRASRRPRPIA